MAVFHFRARDGSGELVKGSLEADSQTQAAREIRTRELFLLELQEEVGRKNIASFLPQKSKGSRDLALFSYQLGAMLGAGLPLLTAMELVRKQSSSDLKIALLGIEEALKEGDTMANAMGRQPEVFPALMIGMIEGGELGGILEKVLTWLANHYEREAQLLEKIKSALAYPLLVLALTLLSLIFLLTYVLPNFAMMLGNMGVPLPYLTSLVLQLSYLFTNWGLYLGLVIVLLGYIAYRSLRTPEFRSWWDQKILQIPLLGDLLLKLITARFCRILGSLLDNGVPILQALEVVKKTLGNQSLITNLELAEVSLREGRGLAIPLTQGGIFPQLLLQMVATGEETGKLPEFLLKISDFYDQEVERSLERLTALLEPTLVLLLGTLVGGIVLAILLPLFSMIGSI